MSVSIASTRVGTRRYGIFALLLTMSLINYFDRAVLSIAMPVLIQAFSLTPVAVGYLLSAFIWSYAPLQFPAGILLDRWGTRRTAGGALALWSVATMLTGFAFNFASLFFTRLLLGVGESPTFPLIARAIREWAPVRERSLAFAITGSGGLLGTAFSSVLIAWLLGVVGWRASFFISGGMGLVWVAVWLTFFRDPKDAGWLSPGERQMILDERAPGGTQDTYAMPLRELLSYRTMWGLFLVQGLCNYANYMLLTWMPTYLVRSRGLNIMHSGVQTAIVYGGAVVLMLLFGRLCDRALTPAAVKAGKRRYAVAIFALGAAVVMLAPVTQSETLLLVELMVSVACTNTVFACNYSLTNDLLHAGRSIGSAIGFIQLGGNLLGLSAPIATGYMVEATGSFASAFVLSGALLCLGALVAMTAIRKPVGEAAT